MAKSRTLHHYLIKVQAIVALLVVLIYTILLNWYFIRGLDESTFINMYQEVKIYLQAYENKEQPQKSLLSKGYLGWQQLPDEVKREFPTLKQISEVKMKSHSIFNNDKFISLPDSVLFVIAHPMADGNTFYLVQSIKLGLHKKIIDERIHSALNLTWPLVLIILLIFIIGVHLIVKSLTQPMRRLGDWSDSLTLNNINNKVPDFRFSELNRIANQQQSSLLRISEVLAKEQDFLRNASHELRTPITVVKSNSELLERILENQKCRGPIERIKRAALNMQHMTETLLWLSNNEKKPEELTTEPVDITQMIKQLIKDNRYLLQNKQIKIDLILKTQQQTLHLAVTPCHIILNNLIRNAFQYTYEGKVTISFCSGKVQIKNINISEDEIDHTGADYGYGLGLQLVDKMIEKLNWQYQNQEIPGGRLVSITFR